MFETMSTLDLVKYRNRLTRCLNLGKADAMVNVNHSALKLTTGLDKAALMA